MNVQISRLSRCCNASEFSNAGTVATRLEKTKHERYHLSDLNRLPNYKTHERIRGIDEKH